MYSGQYWCIKRVVCGDDYVAENEDGAVTAPPLLVSSFEVVAVVSNGVLKTAGDNDILQGVSRMTVFDLAEQLGMPVVEEDVQPYDVYTADEAFLCSTPYCILPVGRADNRPLGDSVPGPITDQLLAAWSEKVGLDIVDQLGRLAQ